MLRNFSLFLPLPATLEILLPAPSSPASRTPPAPFSPGLPPPCLPPLNTRALISQALANGMRSEQTVPRLMARVVGITSKDLLEEPNILERISEYVTIKVHADELAPCHLTI